MREASRVGVFFCQEGSEPLDGIDLPAVGDYARVLPGVTHVELRECRPRLEPQRLARELAARELEVLVLAGVEPGRFKPAFARALELAGRDAVSLRLASFLQQGALALHSTERAKAVVQRTRGLIEEGEQRVELRARARRERQEARARLTLACARDRRCRRLALNQPHREVGAVALDLCLEHGADGGMIETREGLGLAPQLAAALGVEQREAVGEQLECGRAGDACVLRQPHRALAAAAELVHQAPGADPELATLALGDRLGHN